MLNYLIAPFLVILKHHKILLVTTLNEVRGKYAAAGLGSLWVFVGPGILLLIYGSVHTMVFRVSPRALTESGYILYVCSGLVSFLAFTAGLSAGAASLTSNKQILLNTVFPSELLPMKSVLVSSLVLPAGMTLVLAADLVYGSLSIHLLLVPVIMILEIMFLVGVAWLLSLLNLLIRDIQQLLNYTTLFFLAITPIAYTKDMIPSHLLPVIEFNPLYYFVSCFQSLIAINSLPEPRVFAVTCLMSLTVFVVGYSVYNKLKLAMFELA